MESEERTKQERESRVSVSSLPGLRVGFEMRNMYEKCMLLAVAVFCATVSVGVAKAQEKEGTSLMKPEEKTRQEQESHVRVSSPPGLRVGNDVVSIGISDRTAGAVCSLIYDGMEFVDDYDHGRQFQVAWSYERDIVDNELYNPTEGGSGSDGTKPTSTSRLLSVKAEGNVLITESHPAYWSTPNPVYSQSGKHVENTACVTNDRLTKKVTVGYKGDPRVLLFETTVHISTDLTGPPISSMRIEAPTTYAPAVFRNYFYLDLQTENLTRLPDEGEPIGWGLTIIWRSTDFYRYAPIMCTPDKKYAVGMMYMEKREDFAGYYMFGTPGVICNKITLFYEHPAQAGKTYHYRAFVIVGDLESVKNSMIKCRKIIDE